VIPALHKKGLAENTTAQKLRACQMRRVKIVKAVFSLAAIICSIAAASWVGLALLGF
jgi:hypothetical protein